MVKAGLKSGRGLCRQVSSVWGNSGSKTDVFVWECFTTAAWLKAISRGAAMVKAVLKSGGCVQ